jgi:hypothetical protein
MYDNGAISWATIAARETVTDQVILEVDEDLGTTRTITSKASHDSSLTRIDLAPTNEAGTVTYDLHSVDEDGKTIKIGAL